MSRIYYMAHPLGNGYDRPLNIARAERWFAWLLYKYPEYAFTAPWIQYAKALPETSDNRDRGIRDDLEVLKRCDGIVLVGGRLSPGMACELEEALWKKMDVMDLLHLGSEPGHLL